VLVSNAERTADNVEKRSLLPMDLRVVSETLKSETARLREREVSGKRQDFHTGGHNAWVRQGPGAVTDHEDRSLVGTGGDLLRVTL